MTGEQDTKRAWRQRLRARRRAIPDPAAERAARAAAAHLAASPLWTRTRRIALYLPSDGELDTRFILSAARAAGMTVFLPAVAAGVLRLRRWDRDAPLERNRYGIEEPPAHAPEAESIDLLVAPLVGWGWGGYRLGMGGGYFDRYLANPAHRPGCFLGLAYECQREDSLQTLQEPWDRNLDGVLTEKGLRSFGS